MTIILSSSILSSCTFCSGMADANTEILIIDFKANKTTHKILKMEGNQTIYKQQ